MANFVTSSSSFGIGVASQATGSGKFNTGVDLGVSIIDGSGSFVDLGGEVTSFKATPNFKDIEVDPISNNGEPDYADVPSGWRGTFMVTRYNGALDNRQADQEELYHTTGDFPQYTITQRVRNKVDGSVNVYQFQRCTLRVEDPGDYKKDGDVPVTATFKASRRKRLS